MAQKKASKSEHAAQQERLVVAGEAARDAGLRDVQRLSGARVGADGILESPQAVAARLKSAGGGGEDQVAAAPLAAQQVGESPRKGRTIRLGGGGVGNKRALSAQMGQVMEQMITLTTPPLNADGTKPPTSTQILLQSFNDQSTKLVKDMSEVFKACFKDEDVTPENKKRKEVDDAVAKTELKVKKLELAMKFQQAKASGIDAKILADIMNDEDV